MGNKSGKEESHCTQSSQNDVSSKSSPFEDIPQLMGPDLFGWYYHEDDQGKSEKDISHNIQFKFKYTAFDYQNNYQNNINNEHKIDHNKCRYEWTYIAPDNVAHIVSKDDFYFDSNEDRMVKLPNKYEIIRAYLAKRDPIPPYFLRTSKMSGLVFQDASKNSLCKETKLKCRIATNCIGKMVGVKMEHPALLIWRRDEIFCEYDDKPVTMIHLTTLPVGYKDKEEKESDIDRIEIQCRTINKTQLDDDKWDYKSYKQQLLDLDNGLLDIAHWCLKYEIDNDYKYQLYSNNSRHFMIALCEAYKIEYDAKYWTDHVFKVRKPAKKALLSWN